MNKISICLLISLSWVQCCLAQSAFKLDHGTITFTSDAPLELIQGYTEQLRGVVNPTSGEMAFLVEIRTFEGFKSDLQRTHFHENYMETSKFPKASFSGKFISKVDFYKQGVQEVEVQGQLEIHGISKEQIVAGTLNIQDGMMYIRAKCPVELQAFGIAIPKIMFQKLAEEVLLDFDFMLKREE